jgi:hypothetical protein
MIRNRLQTEFDTLRNPESYLVRISHMLFTG